MSTSTEEYAGVHKMLCGNAAGTLAQTLAWAASQGVGFDIALLTLTEDGIPSQSVAKLRHKSSQNWNAQLTLAALDLRDGQPLHLALRRRLHHFLPSYYLLAVEQAERSGHLPRILPCLAQHLSLVSDRRSKLGYQMIMPAIVFTAILCISAFLLTFIIPKYGRIYVEFSEPGAPSLVFPWAARTAIAGFNFFWNKLTLCCLAASACITYRLGPWLWPYVEGWMLKLPLTGRLLQQDALLEVAGGIGAFLACGEDVGRAAELCQQASHRPWLKKRLAVFVATVRSGRPWLEAWEQLKLGKPLHHWIIRNAAARERPVEGFDQLRLWLAHEHTQGSRLLVRCLEFGAILVNASLVTLMGVAILGSLATAITYLAKH